MKINQKISTSLGVGTVCGKISEGLITKKILVAMDSFRLNNFSNYGKRIPMIYSIDLENFNFRVPK